jgi:hypothetical protein
MTFTKDDALDTLALIVYKRRTKQEVCGAGSAEYDRRAAENIWGFFDRYNGAESIEDILMNHTYKDYKDYLPFYQFLKEQING